MNQTLEEKIGKLTDRQREVYEVVVEMTANNNDIIPPIRAIQKEAGLSSVSESFRYIEIFIKKGVLRRINDHYTGHFAKYELVTE